MLGFHTFYICSFSIYGKDVSNTFYHTQLFILVMPSLASSTAYRISFLLNRAQPQLY